MSTIEYRYTFREFILPRSGGFVSATGEVAESGPQLRLPETPRCQIIRGATAVSSIWPRIGAIRLLLRSRNSLSLSVVSFSSHSVSISVFPSERARYWGTTAAGGVLEVSGDTLFVTPMVIAADKLIVGSVTADIKYSSSNAIHGSSPSSHRACLQKFGQRFLFGVKPTSSFDPLRRAYRSIQFKENHLSCFATNTEKENYTNSSGCVDEDGKNPKTARFNDSGRNGSSSYSKNGLAEACKYVCNDAKFVNERAKNDLILLARGLARINDRACHDAKLLGHEFLKLDARAREDTEKIDSDVKMKAARLTRIATVLKDKAGSDLKRAADQHWSDGALEADLRRADFLVKRRAMEDSFMALKLVSDVHNMMVNKMNQQRRENTLDAEELMASSDRITAIQEAYWSMASAFSEADGVDYTDPDELELLVTTLIDLDAMDGKSTVSLLAECSISPDVNTRKALANALSTAPSMWTLGNAGMGALKRLAEDSNPAVAAAASKAIEELRSQWALQEGDNLQHMLKELLKREKEDEKEE